MTCVGREPSDSPLVCDTVPAPKSRHRARLQRKRRGPPGAQMAAHLILGLQTAVEHLRANQEHQRHCRVLCREAAAQSRLAGRHGLPTCLPVRVPAALTCPVVSPLVEVVETVRALVVLVAKVILEAVVQVVRFGCPGDPRLLGLRCRHTHFTPQPANRGRG